MEGGRDTTLSGGFRHREWEGNHRSQKQYNFLYFKGKRKEPVFEIWYKDFMSNESKIIANYLLNKYQKEYCVWLDSSNSILKKFAPIPNPYERQKDGYYHAYIRLIN